MPLAAQDTNNAETEYPTKDTPSRRFVYLDTETCGLHGPVVLIQYAFDDGEIKLHCPWTEPVIETMKLIESFLDYTVVGFNLSFDWFHICQLYTTLSLLDGDSEPDIEAYALAEIQARDGLCLKPKNAFDLMLHARKGPYQSMMEREDVRIKKIPRILAQPLVDELNHRIKLKDVYFARRKDKKDRWRIHDIKDDVGDTIPDFVDLVLAFAPSSALKVLAQDALGYDAEDITVFKDIELPESSRPVEYGYAPFALAVGKPGLGNWNGAWPEKIKEHIIHWGYNRLAREYARDDVKYTRQLHYFFSAQVQGMPDDQCRMLAREDKPTIELLLGGDDDSILACMVGAVRWHGYRIDIPKLKALRTIAENKQSASKYNFNSTDVTRRYLKEVLSDVEALVMSRDEKISTKGIILEEIAKWKQEEICEACGGIGCNKCENSGTIKTDKPHPAAVRAQEILDYRHAGKEIELYDKLLLAGRLHASFNVIGALSGRMSGADGLNPQGIKRAKEVRSCFPLAPEGYVLSGGDFSGFEVCLADAVYNDPELRKDLLTKRPCKKCAKIEKKKPGTGKKINWVNNDGQTVELIAHDTCDECKGAGVESTKIHALFGQFLFPPLTYDQIYDTKGLPGEQDKYSRSKNGVFALLYGGEAYTLVTRVGVAESVANEAYQRWVNKYIVWGQARKKIVNMFCSMRQTGGIGSKVEWAEPAEYIESMLGFRRYFTLENEICRALFHLAEEPPKEWSRLKIKVVRRDREQSAAGAVRSALFAAAFGIQSGNMRAAANHVIQSSGAGFCKKLQCELWELQPSGVHQWHIIPMNIHDELMTPALPPVIPKIRPIIDDFIDRMRKLVPLADIDWSERLSTWADK
jgi:hypothetical protein